MLSYVALSKANELLPAEDYMALRRQAIHAIEQLGSNHWIDYNESDPGITILEALVYAITDLSYRTGFDVKDLLAPEELNDDTWKQVFYTARQILHNSPLTTNDYRKMIVDVVGVRNAWLTPSKDYEVPVWIDYNYYEYRKKPGCSCASEETPCFGRLQINAVTEAATKIWRKNRLKTLDEKKKVIEKKIADVCQQSAAVEEAVNKAEHSSELQETRKKNQQQLTALQYDLNAVNKEQTLLSSDSLLPSKIVEFEGLYNVMVEYEEDVLELEQREEVRQRVVERLFKHRNLCEDFLSVNAVDYVDFGIAASLVLHEYADPDDVVSKMFFVIYKNFTPSIPFNTLDQMMAKGYLVDEIFEGPALNHGFIDDNDLLQTELFRDIRLSDLVSEIADIAGIKAITYLYLPFEGFGKDTQSDGYFNEWVRSLKNEQKIARIQPEKSVVLLCKERDFVSYFTGTSKDRQPARMLRLFKNLKAIERDYKLKGYQNDFEVPAGTNMNLEDYFPVTESLPLCYGVSERAGVGNADEYREKQALQLKGYLLFFEQLLKNYLVQLNNLGNLYSFDDSVKHTYFTSVLHELQDLAALLVNDSEHPADNPAALIGNFAGVLQNIAEPNELFFTRRNTFLNHLLARFAEDLGEYESISRWLTPDGINERLMHDKSRLLKNGEYYKISTNRGRAFDYSAINTWNSVNISGTERRISRLLGFRNINRRTLSPAEIVVEALFETDPKTKTPVAKKDKQGNELNTIKIVDGEQGTLLTSVDVRDGCCTETLINDLLAAAGTRINFVFHDELKQRSRKTAGLLGTFWFELYDGPDTQTAVLLAESERFEEPARRDEAYKRLQQVIRQINDNEGLHLVEHLLLRPRFDEVFDEVGDPVAVSLLDVCLNECDRGIGLGEATDVPHYRKKIHRVPADKCYDKLPWILEYLKLNSNTGQYDTSILFQEAFPDASMPVPLKFRRYEALAQRVKDLHEYGSERMNYGIVSNQEEQPEKLKYSFIIHGHKGVVLVQSPFIFNKKTKIQQQNNTAIPNDIEKEIEALIQFFEFQLDLYCAENPCDNNEDPYSFRATVVLPCWPKRLRDATFKNLVEKTILTETPAHVHTRIVWLGVLEMARFEKAYADWLLEMAQTEMPAYEKVNPLVDVLNTLVPCGACADDCSHTSESERLK